jgi:hypothetical protein
MKPQTVAPPAPASVTVQKLEPVEGAPNGPLFRLDPGGGERSSPHQQELHDPVRTHGEC